MEYRGRHSSSAYEIGSLTGLSWSVYTSDILNLDSVAYCKGILFI